VSSDNAEQSMNTERLLARLWEVANASRVLQQNVGRQTGPMWMRLDNAFRELDKVTK